MYIITIFNPDSYKFAYQIQLYNGSRVMPCHYFNAYNNIHYSWTLYYLQDAGGQGVGFMLGSLNVNYALTSEACLKGLGKTASGEIVTFRGT